MKVQAKRFHLNGHIIGFHLQTKKLESPNKIPSNTLPVKELVSHAHRDMGGNPLPPALSDRPGQCQLTSTLPLRDNRYW